MKWQKLGTLFSPDGTIPWMASHAALPVADPCGDLLRIYFSSRDSRSRSQIGRLDLHLEERRVARVFDRPVVALGELGAFDDSGVTSACLVNHAGRKYQYFTGWSLGVTVPFYLAIGLAISEDDGHTFQKISPSPVLGRDAADPFLTASPCVLIENGVWRMWYVSGLRWDIENQKPKHYYHIRYAESSDGIRWEGARPVCIDFQSPEEHAIGRPSVWRDGAIYKMCYCYRGAAYRIGYAESSDGIRWNRMDECAGITQSASGWDSAMLAYPFVFQYRGEMYLLYNGNGYGKTGIGLAVAETP